MLRRILLASVILMAAVAVTNLSAPQEAQAAGRGQPTDWNRFFYYPYVYYPHNFQRQQGSFNHLYYRYPPNMRVPVYNKNWYNFYPTERPYHRGHHFILDVF
ncbi:MAG: hypothetical protein CMJ78_09925 [Planctomycetaceae bacterium]|nr:hypothetical protein [Planctomycetaceae bacterium]